MRKMLSAVAFVGAIGIAGAAQARDKDQPIQPSREGHPPAGVIRSEIMLRAAHDGRAETGGVDRHFRAMPSEHRERPDSNAGQIRHMALPIKSDILQRVSLGDGREASRGMSGAGHDKMVAQPHEVKSYPGRDGWKPHLPIPLKTEITIRLEAAATDFDSHIDDPKVLRANGNKEDTAHRDTRVYPGRYESKPTVPEMFMKVQKRHSAQGDSAGDKDAG